MAEKFDDDIKLKKSDKYIPEGTERFDEFCPKILEVIAKFHCTLPQIKRAAKIPLHLDISPILDLMEEKKLIQRLYNGTYTAFFSDANNNKKGATPTKFWLIGDDRVAVSYETTQKPVGQPKFAPPVSKLSPNATFQPLPATVEFLRGDSFQNRARFVNEK